MYSMNFLRIRMIKGSVHWGLTVGLKKVDGVQILKPQETANGEIFPHYTGGGGGLIEAALSIFVIVDCWWSGSSSTFSLSCVVYEGFSSIDIRLSPENAKASNLSSTHGKVGSHSAGK